MAPHWEAMAPSGAPLPPQAMSIPELVEIAIDQIPKDKWLLLLMDECKLVTRRERTAVNVSRVVGHFCGMLVGKVAAEIGTMGVIPSEERLDEIILKTVKRCQGGTQVGAAAVASGLLWLAGWWLHQYLFLMMWTPYNIGAWTPVVGAVAVAAGAVAAYCSAGETLKSEVSILLREQLAEQMPDRDPRRSRSSTPQEARFAGSLSSSSTSQNSWMRHRDPRSPSRSLTPQEAPSTHTPQTATSTPTPQEATSTHNPQEAKSTATSQAETSTATSKPWTSTATPQLTPTTFTHTPQAANSSEKPQVARVVNIHVSNCSVGNTNFKDGNGSRDSACVYNFHFSNYSNIEININSQESACVFNFQVSGHQ